MPADQSMHPARPHLHVSHPEDAGELAGHYVRDHDQMKRHMCPFQVPVLGMTVSLMPSHMRHLCGEQIECADKPRKAPARN